MLTLVRKARLPCQVRFDACRPGLSMADRSHRAHEAPGDPSIFPQQPVRMAEGIHTLPKLANLAAMPLRGHAPLGQCHLFPSAQCVRDIQGAVLGVRRAAQDQQRHEQHIEAGMHSCSYITRQKVVNPLFRRPVKDFICPSWTACCSVRHAVRSPFAGLHSRQHQRHPEGL